MLLLGLGCNKQVGKDTAAEYLEKKFSGRVRRVSFADKLKQVAIDLFALSNAQCYGSQEDKEAIDPRYGISSRDILKGIGNKMREIYSPIWIDTVFNSTIPVFEKQGYDVFIFSDVRFPNEANKIKDRGGYLVKVFRNTNLPVDTDISETALNDYVGWDFQIENNGSLDEYFQKIDRVLEVINQNGRKA